MNNHNSDQRRMNYNRPDYHQPNQRQMSNYDQPVRNTNHMHPNDHYGKPMQRQYSNSRQPQYQQNRGQNRSNGPSMHHQQMRMQNQRYHSPNDNQYHQDDMAPLQEQYVQQEQHQAPMNKHPVRYENQPQKYQNNLNQRRESREPEQFQDQQDRQGQDPRRMQNANGVRNKPVFNNEGQEIFEVYIHNVDFEVTANDVVNQFRHCGPIDHWKFPRKDATRQNHGRHKGYGFIFFKTLKGQINALNMRRSPPYIGNRHINISDNSNFHEEDEQQRMFEEEQFLNQNRSNMREQQPREQQPRDQMPRQQDQFYGRYEPMDRFQRFEGQPRMMERFPEQRRNFDENVYQNNMDQYIPPRNIDRMDDLRGEMVMQKYQSSRDFDRGRINTGRQYQDEQSEEIQYMDRNPNLVVVKKSNENFQDQQDHYPLNIQKKSDGENEKYENDQNWKEDEYNKPQEKEQSGGFKTQPEQREAMYQQQEENQQQTPKSKQSNQNEVENLDNQQLEEKPEQFDQDDQQSKPKMDDQSEKKSAIAEQQDENKKTTPINEDFKFNQTIGSPNEDRQEAKENLPQVQESLEEPQDLNIEKSSPEKINPETNQQIDVLQKDIEKDQHSDDKVDEKLYQETYEQKINEKQEGQENRDRRDQRDRELHQYQYQQQLMQQMPYGEDEPRMSKTDSYATKVENTNKYNPNNREFIGYKSDVLGKDIKDTRNNTRDNRDHRSDNRSRGGDYDILVPRHHNNDRMMRGGNSREMKQNDNRREDHRRMENIHMVNNRSLRNQDYRQEPDSIRKDDHYGRPSYNRVNDMQQDRYTPNRGSRDVRQQNNQYGPGPVPRVDHRNSPAPRVDHRNSPAPRVDHRNSPAPRVDHRNSPVPRLDQRNNVDDRKLQNKRPYHQMDMDQQGYHNDPNKRQRRHEENEEHPPIQQQRQQMEKRDSPSGRQMEMNHDARAPISKNDQNDRTKQYNDWKNQFNENRNIEEEYDSDSRYQQNYRSRQMDDKSKDKRKYNNTSPERLNYEKQQNDDGHIDQKHKQYEMKQALDLYGDDDNNYNIHENQSSNQDHFDNYDDFENKSISFHEQLNEEKQQNKQKYRNK